MVILLDIPKLDLLINTILFPEPCDTLTSIMTFELLLVIPISVVSLLFTHLEKSPTYPPTPDIPSQEKFFNCKSRPFPVLSTHTGLAAICSLVIPEAEYLATIPSISGKESALHGRSNIIFAYSLKGMEVGTSYPLDIRACLISSLVFMILINLSDMVPITLPPHLCNLIPDLCLRCLILLTLLENVFQ